MRRAVAQSWGIRRPFERTAKPFAPNSGGMCIAAISHWHRQLDATSADHFGGRRPLHL